MKASGNFLFKGQILESQHDARPFHFSEQDILFGQFSFRVPSTGFDGFVRRFVHVRRGLFYSLFAGVGFFFLADGKGRWIPAYSCGNDGGAWVGYAFGTLENF